MAFLGYRRGNITTPVINSEDQAGLEWHRLLFSSVAMPATKHAPAAAAILAPAAVNLGPATPAGTSPAPTDHAEPMLTAPLDSETFIAADPEPARLGTAPVSTGSVAAPLVEEAASPVANAAAPPLPILAPSPITEASSPAAPVPADAAPPAGHLPKSEAILWSGPAIMAFPPESHDSDGAAASGVAETAGAPAAPDVADTPDFTGVIDAVTRDDLDPVLAAMGSGENHAAPSDGAGDLSAAFLPAGGSDLAHPGHGLDPGFAFLPQPPPPPPPDFI